MFGHCIYKSAQGVRVFQNPLYRWLHFESRAIQTLINRYFPYKPGLSYLNPLILPVQIQPEDCCMLGLGGGGAAHALSSYLGDFKLVIVEANSEVIDIAHRFFMIGELKNLNIIHQDASLFVRNCNTKFQHILVDLFTAKSFPTQCHSEEFFIHCKQLLKPGGLLAINLANRQEQWPIFQLIQKQFPRSTIAIPVTDSANMIILAQNSHSITTYLDILKKSKKLQGLVWDAKWGCIAKIR